MKLALIPQWKKALKLASVQIALVLVVLESLQAMVDLLPDSVAQVIRGILVAALPFARLIQQHVEDE